MKSLGTAVIVFFPRLLAIEVQLTYTPAGLDTVGGLRTDRAPVSYKIQHTRKGPVKILLYRGVKILLNP